jgi:hypothetical protein
MKRQSRLLGVAGGLKRLELGPTQIAPIVVGRSLQLKEWAELIWVVGTGL